MGDDGIGKGEPPSSCVRRFPGGVFERGRPPAFAGPRTARVTNAAARILAMPGGASLFKGCNADGIVFFAGKCIYEKGLFWLLLILRGAFFGRIFPSLAPRSGAFFTQKKAASALQIAIFSVLLLRKMS